MSEPIDTGGSAFPIIGSEYIHGRREIDPAEGMTIRDHFAGLAMQGIISTNAALSADDAAKIAYQIAGAMIQARKEQS